MPNKFKATWLSHSSIGAYKKCPLAYYYGNVYKNPETNRKISVVSPFMTLGVAVHDVIEPLAWLPKEERFNQDLEKQFLDGFDKYKGHLGGFRDLDQFEEFKRKGVKMISNVIDNPGPISRPALRLLPSRSELPWIWLDEDEELIISGKTDWLEYVEKNKTVNIIDFKTGAKEEDANSLQFKIYQLLMRELKPKFALGKAYYWYLAFKNEPSEKELPDINTAKDEILKYGLQIKEARAAKNFKCKYGSCRNCEPYLKVINGEAEFVGIGGYGSESYYLN